MSGKVDSFTRANVTGLKEGGARTRVTLTKTDAEHKECEEIIQKTNLVASCPRKIGLRFADGEEWSFEEWTSSDTDY